MPGGDPQGTILGMFLFIIFINAAGFEGQNRSLGKLLTQPVKGRRPITNIHLKFIDDMTVAEAVNLKKTLVHCPDYFSERPVPFHSRSEHFLPANMSELQKQINQIEIYSNDNEMEINTKKTKAMIFNKPRRKIDFFTKYKTIK